MTCLNNYNATKNIFEHNYLKFKFQPLEIIIQITQLHNSTFGNQQNILLGIIKPNHIILSNRFLNWKIIFQSFEQTNATRLNDDACNA